MASFEKRSGNWRAIVQREHHGRMTRTFDTKAEAEAWATIVESEIARGVFVSRTEAEATTLAEALMRYAREITPTKKPSTAKRERDRIAVLAALPLARQSLAAIRGADIATFIRERQKQGLGPSAVRADLSILSHLFTVAVSAWGLESLSNPVKRTRGQRPKLPQGRNRRLVGDEQARLLAAADDHPPLSPLIVWAIETGMRRGEIAAMRWEHLDRKARVLLIPETKNGTPRRVPLSAAAAAVLDALPRRWDGRVWGVQPDFMTRSFQQACTTANISDMTFHDLRHEATSRFFEKGLNPMQVAAITGHKTLQMLKRYTHLRAEDLVGMLG